MGKKADFLAEMYRAGISAGLTDAAARVMASQAAVESDYGTSDLATTANNFFGIKAITREWTGPVVDHATQEVVDGKAVTVIQPFRRYASPEAGIADRVAYMRVHFPAFSAAPTQGQAFEALQNGTYGKYYTASRADYEASLTRVQQDYFPATVTVTHPVPLVPVPSGATGVPKINDISQGGKVGGMTFPPNTSTQQRSSSITGIVFHHTAGTTLSSALGAGEQHVGATYYIDTDGSIYRYAADDTVRVGISDPGNSHRTDVGKPTAKMTNDNTISVEIVAPDSEHFTEAQKAAALSLGGYLAKTYSIDPSMIVGHGDIQGGAGGNKMPTEGVALAAYVRNSLVQNPALLAVDAAAPRADGVSNVGMAFAGSGTKGSLAKLDQMRLDQAKREMYQSAAFGVREAGVGEGTGVQANGAPAGVERGTMSVPPVQTTYGKDVTDLAVFPYATMGDGASIGPDIFSDGAMLHGGAVLANDIGSGPVSWFDTAGAFGSTVVAPSGSIPLSTTPAPPQDAPVPRQRPAALQGTKAAAGASEAAGAPKAPAARMVKLPSGKLIQEGSYRDPKTGTVTIITAGPNGEAEINNVREGIAGELHGGIVGSIIGQTIAQKGGEALQAIKQNASEATTNIGATVGQASQQVTQAVPAMISGLQGKLGSMFGGFAQSPQERLRNIIQTARGGPVLSPADIGEEPASNSSRSPAAPRSPAPMVWATPLRIAGPLPGPVGRSIDRGLSEADTRAEQRQERLTPMQTSMSTVKTPVGVKPTPETSPIRAATTGNLEAGGAAYTSKPVSTTVTELKPNPEYARWQQMNASGSPDDRHLTAPPLVNVSGSPDDRQAGSSLMAAGRAAAGAAAPRIVAAPVKPPPPKFIPVTRTVITHPSVAHARTGGQGEVPPVSGPPPQQMVTLRSGRTVAVGTQGTSQGGRYVYQVQSDGSVKELRSGRTTAAAA